MNPAPPSHALPYFPHALVAILLVGGVALFFAGANVKENLPVAPPAARPTIMRIGRAG